MFLLRSLLRPKGRLVKVARLSESARIKTGRALWKGPPKGSKVAQVINLSLVAGDVTGGGGKATRPKTKRHCALF